jgi:hypothetical protein
VSASSVVVLRDQVYGLEAVSPFSPGDVMWVRRDDVLDLLDELEVANEPTSTEVCGEVLVIAGVYALMATLDHEAQVRVMVWLRDRLAADDDKAEREAS